MPHARGFLLTLFALAATPVLLWSFPSGISGYTLKTNANGCGNCHGGTQTATVSIKAPASLTTSQAAQCTVIVAGSNTGVDIAASGGTLAAVSRLKALNGELTHPSMGSGTYVFTFTAPASPGTVTLYATGLSGAKDGPWAHASNATVSVNAIASVEESVPATFSLEQNFPNPFNPATTITYTIPAQGAVALVLFDLSGRVVTTLVDEVQPAGSYRVTFTAKGLASGIYFARLTA
jgi:hypothetical protein